MGICPSLSPEERAIEHANESLKATMLTQLRDLYMYNFNARLRATISDLASRFLLNQGIIEDIDKLMILSHSSPSIKSDNLNAESLQQDLRKSCLILEDQFANENEPPQKMHNSFQQNMSQYQSLVVQINIIYKQDFELQKYNKSLNFFLKWGNVFQQHFYGGLLKPIYKQFCESLYKIPIEQSQTIVDEINVFVQYMVTIYTHIYGLKSLSESQNGDLFKNQNIYNMIMSFMFKRTKISKFIRKMICIKQKQLIQAYSQKLLALKDQGLEYFRVNKQFLLIEQNDQGYESKPLIKAGPYSNCNDLILRLSQPNQTPITKLKIIVEISKKIMKEIYDHYDRTKAPQVPDLDPDNLTSIIMYLICQSGKAELYQQLKIVEYFTTTNCLNCISGFYLNTFNAAIQAIIQIK